MNIPALKQSAIDLREKLEFYKHKEQSALALYQQLEHLISAAECGMVKEKIEARDIPGYRIFADTDIQQYDDLSKAYSRFYVEITDGRSTKAYQIIQEMLGKEC
jgi:hypothetical protein